MNRFRRIITGRPVLALANLILIIGTATGVIAACALASYSIPAESTFVMITFTWLWLKDSAPWLPYLIGVPTVLAAFCAALVAWQRRKVSLWIFTIVLALLGTAILLT